MDRKIVEYLLQGKSGREIMKTLHIGDRKVKKVKALAEHYGYLDGSTPLPVFPEALFPDGPERKNGMPSEPDSLLLSKKEWITERLRADWHPITIFEELGLPVGRSSFYRFLHRHELMRIGEDSRRVVPEIIHRPGEALLLDWGKLRDVVDPQSGKKMALWAFVGVLGFSRYMMVRLVWSNDTQQTLLAIESMLREIGGVPSRITSDNPKCFALEASAYEPILNPVFERFAAHYGILIECLPPADPQKKGKVERPMPYVRRLYEAHGSEWKGIDESQEYLNRKIAIANERKHGTTRMKPIEQFLAVESESLEKLPPLSYSPEEFAEANVRRDGHVRFANKYYSVPEQLIGKPVTILGTSSQVSIYHQGKLIEVHSRLAAQDPLQSKSTKEHHKKPWERAMQDHSLYRKRAQAIGPQCDELILILLNQGQGFIDTRKIWGILSLDKSYTKGAINDACKQAIELGSYSYQTVKRLIRLTAHPLTSSTEPKDSAHQADKKTSHKFVRPMSVYEEQLKLLLH